MLLTILSSLPTLTLSNDRTRSYKCFEASTESGVVIKVGIKEEDLEVYKEENFIGYTISTHSYKYPNKDLVMITANPDDQIQKVIDGFSQLVLLNKLCCVLIPPTIK